MIKTGLTDSQGNYKVELPNGDYSYTVKTDGYKDLGPEEINVDSVDKIIESDIKNNKYYSIVFDTGIEGATIIIDERTLTTNESGFATADNMLAGTFPYSVTKDRHKTVTGSVVVDSDKTIPIELIQVNIVTIRAIDESTDNPIPGLTVTFNGIVKTTNASGEAVFTEVETGNYDFTIQAKPPYKEYTGTITVSSQDVLRVVELLGNFQVTFIVKGLGGAFLEGASVVIGGTTVITNANGEATFSLMVEQNHNYSISSNFYKSKTGVTGTITENKTITENLVYLSNVSFTVKKDDSSTVVSGVSITIGGNTLTTDSFGVASIRLEPGNYNAYFSRTGYYEDPTPLSFTVVESATTMQLEKMLYGLYAVTVNTKRASQNQVGIPVKLTLQGSSTPITANTNASGNAIFSNVKYGRYDIEIDEASFYASYSSWTMVDANKTVNVALVPYYSLKFVLANQIIETNINYSGIKTGSTLTDVNGEATLTKLTAGTLNYTIETDDFDTVTKNLTIPSVPTGTLLTENVNLTLALNSISTLTLGTEGYFYVTGVSQDRSVITYLSERHNEATYAKWDGTKYAQGPLRTVPSYNPGKISTYLSNTGTDTIDTLHTGANIDNSLVFILEETNNGTAWLVRYKWNFSTGVLLYDNINLQIPTEVADSLFIAGSPPTAYQTDNFIFLWTFSTLLDTDTTPMLICVWTTSGFLKYNYRYSEDTKKNIITHIFRDTPTNFWGSRTGKAWEAVPLIERAAISLATVGGKIYAFGGRDVRKNRVNTAQSYDPTTGTWTTLANMPRERSNGCAEVVDGKIYTIWGYVGATGTSMTPALDRYDPVTNTWAALTWAVSQPVSTVNSGSAVIDGKIHLFGGSSALGTLYNTHIAVDPINRTWTNKAPMTSARTNFATTQVDGKIWVFGGDEAGTTISTKVESYDPVIDQWKTEVSLPEGVLQGKAVFIDNENPACRRILVFGGKVSTGRNIKIFSFYLEGDNWEVEYYSDYLAFSEMSAIKLDEDNIYLLGGANEQGTVSGGGAVFHPSIKISTGIFTIQPDPIPTFAEKIFEDSSLVGMTRKGRSEDYYSSPPILPQTVPFYEQGNGNFKLLTRCGRAGEKNFLLSIHQRNAGDVLTQISPAYQNTIVPKTALSMALGNKVDGFSFFNGDYNQDELSKISFYYNPQTEDYDMFPHTNPVENSFSSWSQTINFDNGELFSSETYPLPASPATCLDIRKDKIDVSVKNFTKAQLGIASMEEEMMELVLMTPGKKKILVYGIFSQDGSLPVTIIIR